jgi:putative FmdB family regulatory protein
MFRIARPLGPVQHDTHRIIAMPRYDYQCTTCGAAFEATQKMSDPALTTCTCGKEGQVTRMLSAGNGLIFKGSGFYITDYKNGGGSGSAAPAKSESPKASESAAPTCGAGACAACSD